MPPDLAGYQYDRLLGGGADAEVWLAWRAGRSVVVKCDPPGGAGALVAWEAAVLAAVEHPNLVRAEAVEPGPALVLPHLAGGSLRQLLDERGTLTAGEAVAVLTPVAAALDALHGAGFLHGDVKPGNVLLAADGTPVLADLGAARRLAGDSPGPDLPVEPYGGPRGTVAYLDPAVPTGGPATVANDVFALGVTAYELLTGRCPHRGAPVELLAAASAGVHRPLRSWPGVDPAVADAVEAAIDPDPGRRPRSAGELLARVAAAVDRAEVRLPGPAPVEAVHRGGPDRRDQTRRFGPEPPRPADHAPVEGRHRLAVVLVALLGALALAVGALAAIGGERSEPLEAQASPTRPTSAAPACPPAAPVPEAGRSLAVDVDGDGCAERAQWDGSVLVVAARGGERSYRLGRPGDQILAGDWDGDGSATVALYRPDTGQVLYVDRFPEEVGQQVTASRTATEAVGGRARLCRDEDGRSVVRVDPPR